MRNFLSERHGQKISVVAKVSKFGQIYTARGEPKQTILLTQIWHCNQRVADHLWVLGGEWSKGLRIGDVFMTSARVIKYPKGFKDEDKGFAGGLEVDYTLSPIERKKFW